MITQESVEQAARDNYWKKTANVMAENSRPDMVIGFVDGANWVLEQQRWLNPKDQLPGNPGKSAYEHVWCLVKYRGNITILAWNCEHLCWDQEDGDDYECDPCDIDYYLPLECIPKPPKIEQK